MTALLYHFSQAPAFAFTLLATGTGTTENTSLFTSQWLWVIILIFSIALVSLIIAYRSRNAAYQLARIQRDRLKSLNVQLRSQSEELSATNAAKDQLISVISHDLRAPLASLDSCLEIMLTEDLSTEEKDELIRDLQKETYNTLKTLDDLLAWARLQQSGGKFEKESFDIIGLVKEIVGLYQPVAGHKNIELCFSPEAGLQLVIGDPNQIRTVVRNLLSNAIKFTPAEGKVRIDISGSENNVEISVQDEGRGISQDELDKIKDPSNYYTSQGTAGENGTGVGLMLSFEFIARHESELHLVPALPRGTRASFHLKPGRESQSQKSA